MRTESPASAKPPAPPPPASTSAKPSGPPPVWNKGPSDTYHCTRHHPVPSHPGEVMTLSFPHEKKIDFTLKATATDGSTVGYEATGLPIGATLDRATGKFSWLMKGKPKDSFSFVLAAVTSAGGRSEWPLTVTIVDEEQELAWKVGIGLPQWPDCPNVSAHTSDTFLVDDFDGDGHLDVAGVHGDRASIFLFAAGYAEGWGRDESGESSGFQLTHFDGKPVLSFVLPPPAGPILGIEFVLSVGKVDEARPVALAE